jgi:hypothetical protein
VLTIGDKSFRSSDALVTVALFSCPLILLLSILKEVLNLDTLSRLVQEPDEESELRLSRRRYNAYIGN